MKACQMGLEQACDHVQHVLDKYDQDIQYAAINNMSWTSMTVTHDISCRGIMHHKIWESQQDP